LKGSNFDGHAYAKEAIKNGAVALVTERQLFVDVPQIIVENVRGTLGVLSSLFYGNPSEKMQVIGITGTNGKTTVSYMLASILQAANKRVGVIGTLGISYGDTRVSSDLTTPDPIPLNATLSQMYMRGIEYVIMEVSAHALYYKKTAGVRFAACIFTNLTQDHLDFFHAMPAYQDAKRKLFLSEVCPIAILNGDDETGRLYGKMREGEGAKTLYYGLTTPTDAFAVITDETARGTEAMFNINDALFRTTLSLVGRHNVYNALAAASCAVELGFSTDVVAQGLSSLKGVDGRLQWVGEYQSGNIYVDFAHTPDGIGRVLDTLKPYCKGRLICLFGCGGNRDKSKRSIMGEVVAKKADFAILTSDNPRYEDPLDIIGAIEKGYRRFSIKYVIVPERRRAIEYGLDFLGAGDILLVAGKGAEEYQEIMGIKYPFNDHDIIQNVLSVKGKRR
jgi:UDP-N-acetylmuramoyl-L-alanyl-D-glutamate--2,6-diaminopimelate ligase